MVSEVNELWTLFALNPPHSSPFPTKMNGQDGKHVSNVWHGIWTGAGRPREASQYHVFCMGGDSGRDDKNLRGARQDFDKVVDEFEKFFNKRKNNI